MLPGTADMQKAPSTYDNLPMLSEATNVSNGPDNEKMAFSVNGTVLFRVGEFEIDPNNLSSDEDTQKNALHYDFENRNNPREKQESDGDGSDSAGSSEIGSHQEDTDLLYKVQDSPPVYLCIFLGLQQLLMAFAGALSLSSTLSEIVCAKPTEMIRSSLFSSTLFMCGLCTILQPAFGIRLPIFQGASSSFLLPLLALKNLDEWQCTEAVFNSTQFNMTSPEMTVDSDHEDAVLGRLRQLQGSLILASTIQMLIGCTGLIGFLLRFIGPITVVPTISLIGLSLFRVVLIYAPKQWGIAVMTTGLILIFSIFMKEIEIPFPSYNRKTGFQISHFPFFKVFPIILSIVIGWLLCYVLTITEVLPDDNSHVNFYARTDTRDELIRMSPWIYIPYPGQYGRPSFSIGAFLGMMAATMASIIESVGDYYACAKICGLPPPPTHAINRGIATEGFGSILAGLIGTGHGTTSYSGNIGAIGITKVASRRIFYIAGVLTIAISIVGKAAAFLVSIPYPVLGGVQIIIFGMLCSIGLSGIQYIDVKSSRNLTILGVALFSGLLLPEWILRSPDAISTGNVKVDQVITVVIGTPMLIGGLIALFLDNITPGTLEERGMRAWQTHEDTSGSRDVNSDLQVYYPLSCINAIASRIPLCRYVPFLPTYSKRNTPTCSDDDMMKQKDVMA